MLAVTCWREEDLSSNLYIVKVNLEERSCILYLRFFTNNYLRSSFSDIFDKSRLKVNITCQKVSQHVSMTYTETRESKIDNGGEKDYCVGQHGSGSTLY